MSKIPVTPLAKMMAAKENVDLSAVVPTGKDGNVRFINSADIRKHRATPLAKKIAKEKDVDISFVRKDGKVTSSDVLKYAESLGGQGAYRLSGGRSRIYENLSKSVTETIPYTLFGKADVTKAYEYYLSLKEKGGKVSMTDIFMYALSRALRDNNILNTTRKDGYYIKNDDINICLATDSGGNILTPVIHNADRLDISSLAAKRAEFLGKVASSKLSSEEMNGGTFTLSNLGQSPVGHFTPVINHPQSAILGVGRTEDEIYLKDGVLMTRKVSYLSLTADHAIIDGKVAAKFLKDMEYYLGEVENG
ncbi:MAG: 2-oxo acid dehydrogenase subunit E2 [Eubacteriaceae bacterium]|nr:2-oxo acid dehydrogenase subunit E2 [Eubacteriaceae bacterium]